MDNEQIIDAALNAACAAVESALGNTYDAELHYFSEHNSQHRAFAAVMRGYIDFARQMQADPVGALTDAVTRARNDMLDNCNALTIAAYDAAQRALAAAQGV